MSNAEKSDQPAGGTLQFGEFVLDVSGHRLVRNGARVPLTSKAFDTLVALVVRSGQTVEKDELLKEVWPGTFISEETLAQNISTLRKVLGDDAESPKFIVTVPRRGYRFIMPVHGTEPNQLAAPSRRPSSSVTGLVPWVFAGAALLVGGTIIGILITRSSSNPSSGLAAPDFRFTIVEPPGTQFSASGGSMAVSPDGSAIVFIARDEGGEDRLWIRPLDEVAAHVLPGTEGASQPFWSADGSSVAFFSHDHLNAVDVSNGSVRSICRSPADDSVAGTWNGNGDIIFGALRSGLFRVASSGGTAQPVIVSGCSTCAVWPQFLPDGRHFLYTTNGTDEGSSGIFVGSLDSTSSRKISSTRSSTFFANAGYLLYVDHGTLLKRRFEPQHLTFAAEPIEIARDVAWNRSTGRGAFAAAQSGVVVFRPVARSRLTWYSRSGAILGSVGPVGEYDSFSVSPDGRRVAAALVDPRVGTPDLWLFDARESRETRLTFDPGSESDPTWSSDGRRVVYSAQLQAGLTRVESAEVGSGVSRVIPGLGRAMFLGPNRDGVVLYVPDDSRSGIPGAHWLVREDKRLSIAWPPDVVHTMKSRVSPDGRWFAYGQADADSRVMRHALYLRSFPPYAGQWQIAPEGTDPRWRSDSRELFFLGADGVLRSVSIGPRGPAAAPQVILRTRMSGPSGLLGQAYDISPDGSSILAKVPAETPSLVVVVNAWTR